MSEHPSARTHPLLGSGAIAFAGNPLDRASHQRTDPAWIEAAFKRDTSLLIPFFKGDPLIIDGAPGFLTTAARGEFPGEGVLVFLGIDKTGAALFALDASQAGISPDAAPFGDIGAYINLRQIADKIDHASLAIIGQARWLLDWHQRHRFCAACGSATISADGGAKRTCAPCQTDHFPRTDPVAIVLVRHGDHCLLGRGPHFPPGVLSCLAGFAEPGETIEECAIREIREEAGVEITNVCYQLSQPWPFPCSLMIGLTADASARELTLERTEIEEARWLSRKQVQDILGGDQSTAIFLPPRHTIARQLLERWVSS